MQCSAGKMEIKSSNPREAEKDNFRYEDGFQKILIIGRIYLAGRWIWGSDFGIEKFGSMPAAGTILISTKQFVLWGHCCECVKRGDFGIRWLQCPDSASLFRPSHRRGKASYVVALEYLCIHLNFPSDWVSGFERCECRFASLQADNLLLSWSKGWDRHSLGYRKARVEYLCSKLIRTLTGDLEMMHRVTGAPRSLPFPCT